MDVFDGRALERGQTVVVEGSRIAAVGAASSVLAPPGSEVVDGTGRTLLPGFIDTHVHIGLCKPARILAGGITTARDLGWPESRIFSLAQRLAGDPTAGPQLLAAGPMLTAPGGYPLRARWGPSGTGRPVTSIEEATSVVQALAGRGAAVIKVAQEPRAGATLPPEVLHAIVQAAHHEGLAVSSHLSSLEQLDLALAAGVDELAHGLWSEEAIPGATLERMVAAGMSVVPTLHIDPSPARIDNLRRFLAAGGRVIYGTDMGNSGPPQGIDTVELALMCQAGMTVEEALAAATSVAAHHVGLHAKGRIAPGAVADVALVGGNPVADLAVLAHPLLVLREGRRAR
ncbi:MAG: amidohydrolase family protein [Actinomycetota bacterium]